MDSGKICGIGMKLMRTSESEHEQSLQDTMLCLVWKCSNLAIIYVRVSFAQSIFNFKSKTKIDLKQEYFVFFVSYNKRKSPKTALIFNFETEA